MKAGVVNRDERESGLRMILNLGHTVGHAIEQATRYKALLHGEAVGWGMIAALYLARRRGTISSSQAERLENLIHLYGPLPPLKVRARQSSSPPPAATRRTSAASAASCCPSASATRAWWKT